MSAYRNVLLFAFLLLSACGGRTPPATPAPSTAALAAPSLTSLSPFPTSTQTAGSQAGDTPQSAATATGFATDFPAPPSPTSPPPTVPSPVEPYPLAGTAQPGAPVWGYRVVQSYPHDRSAFTQGLVIEDNLTTMLEGTGRTSSLRRTDLESGEILQLTGLPGTQFGEGITLFEDKIYQLTWQDRIGYVYDSQTLDLIGDFAYDHEGWGITHDGSRLIVSDGTDLIRFWDPRTLQETGSIRVSSAQGPVFLLNELEYVDGEILANVWQTDLIARISPEDGRILGWIDLAGLLEQQERDGTEDVLNGIAYDPASGRLFVTGKLWPLIFEIEVVPSNPE